MRVLTWNLFHGRAVPPAGRSLQREFAAALSSWSWDVALLQETPPWWAEPLARAAGARQRRALTSRNLGLPLRRLIADRWPDVIKSNGGGANAILVRGDAIEEHRVERLRWWPERRVAHGVRLASGAWVVNLHAQVHSERRAQADAARAARAARAWAGGPGDEQPPIVLGGDFNTRAPLAEGFEHAGGRGVDHVLARGLRAAGPAVVPDHGSLSDHAPVIAELA